ncbi:MAG: hypothetical protein PHI64_20200 [Zoogloea sp.]|uniref:hypothetical protein n=1 Tax=Zoogloea sp. TaxID=49181 RepID=UPI002608F7FA|nr:hypothetical protein [Zoogloea sp.]MDD2991265.1 hypothetical protein [Zoogloea sp.]
MSLAIELQLSRGQHAEVGHLAWQRFERTPGCEPFFKLLEVVGRIDREAMWNAFCGGKVDVGLWEPVADERSKTNHEEAMALYKRLLPHRGEGGSCGSDDGEAFSLVKKIRAQGVTHKQLGMFGDELAEVLRLEWKRKRSFMKLLDTL